MNVEETECVAGCGSGLYIFVENDNGGYYRCLQTTPCSRFIFVNDAGEETCVNATECRDENQYGYLALGVCDATVPDLDNGHFNVTYKEDEIYMC